MLRAHSPTNLTPQATPGRLCPDRLSPDAWTFARQPVVTAVLAAGPTNAEDTTGKERWERPAHAGKRICANCRLSLAYPAPTPHRRRFRQPQGRQDRQDREHPARLGHSL